MVDISSKKIKNTVIICTSIICTLLIFQIIFSEHTNRIHFNKTQDKITEINTIT